MDDLNIDFTPGHVALIQQKRLLMELLKSGNAGYLAGVKDLKDVRPFLLLESDGYKTTWVPLTTKKGRGYKINPTQKKGSDELFLTRDSYVFSANLLSGPLCAFASSVMQNDYHNRRISKVELVKVREAVHHYSRSISEQQRSVNHYSQVGRTVEPLLGPEVLAQLQIRLGS